VLWRPAGRGQRPLITEALRGAGAVIVDAAGHPVMAGRDLAPRDVVAARMHRVMSAAGASHLWLDATGVGRGGLEGHFPTVTAACRAAGIEPSREPIPVAPGAHYACGGVRADMTGRTSVPGLYAVGEVAATGVHGANRLASNSLTEAIATGRRLGRLLGAEPSPARPPADGQPPGGTGQGGAGHVQGRAGHGQTGQDGVSSVAAGAAPEGRDDLAAAMSRHAGVLRDRDGLELLLARLAAAPAAGRLDLATAEATSLHAVSAMVAVAALARAESRGCHRRGDAPAADGPARRLGLRVRQGRIEVTADSGEPVGVPA
jgi:L-aspartate oxidase